MRNIFINTNRDRDRDGAVTACAVSIVKRCGAMVVETTERADLIICLGGDGTILRIAATAAHFDIPVLGINLGNIGFMTAFDADRLELLREILNGEYLSDRRVMLQAETGGERFIALNDAVVTGEPGRTLGVNLTINGSTVPAFRGDGLIASTPTGSTAYSMSAGGPIADPHSDCIVLTPVCAHTPYARPFVLSVDSETVIGCAERATLTVDGAALARVEAGGTVTVRKAVETLELIRLKSYDFYDIMSKKLWNTARS